ncbi:MAG: hypothetical protein KBD05_01110 [Candidatus Pacebacteria bacterium]|nr:hypothetical protein [Candidatus Paceibacterota bacterium]
MHNKRIRKIFWGLLFLTPPLLFLVFLDKMQGLLTVDTPLPFVLAVLVLPWVFGCVGAILILLGIFNISKKSPVSANETIVSPSAQIKDGLSMIAAAVAPFALVYIAFLFSTPGSNQDGGIILIFFIPVSLVFAILGLYRVTKGLVRKSREGTST